MKFKILINIGFFFSIVFSSGSYEILNLSSDARSLSLNSSASIYENKYLSNNPASLSTRTNSQSYSYLLLPASIHFFSYKNTKQIKIGTSATKISYINYGILFDGQTNEESLAYDVLFEQAFKKEIFNIISVGVSSGMLFSSIAEYKSNVIFTNIGFRTRLIDKRLGLGISYENLGIVTNMYTSLREKIPSLVRLGIYYDLKYIPCIFNINYIFHYNSFFSDYLTLGSEFKLFKNIHLRFAVNSLRKDLLIKDFLFDITSGISGGIGFRKFDMSYDIGFKSVGPAGLILGFSVGKKLN